MMKISGLRVVQVCMSEQCQTNLLFMSGVASKQTSKQSIGSKYHNDVFVISVQCL
jgi:hypothetical protein